MLEKNKGTNLETFKFTAFNNKMKKKIIIYTHQNIRIESIFFALCRPGGKETSGCIDGSGNLKICIFFLREQDKNEEGKGDEDWVIVLPAVLGVALLFCVVWFIR